RADAELAAGGHADAGEPADARQRHALLQPSEQHDPFAQHRRALSRRVELLLELPPDLRDHRPQLDALLDPKLVDDAVAEDRRAEARAGELHDLGWRRRQRLA